MIPVCAKDAGVKHDDAPVAPNPYEPPSLLTDQSSDLAAHPHAAKIDHSRLPTNWDEDHLLPRNWDGNGHARGIMAPGGWIAKTDPEGKTWEIVSSDVRKSIIDAHIDQWKID